MNEFILRFPSSALSARCFTQLDDNEQRELAPLLISNAVYSDTWESYLDYVSRSRGKIAITEDIAHGVVDAVGLDPCSARLWIQAANCCSSNESRLELFQVGLAVPLFDAKTLFEEYLGFAESQQITPTVSEADCAKVAEVLVSERWPDRYADMASEWERVVVRRQWIDLLLSMEGNIEKGVISPELQKQRIDLACRQMCVQLHDDDSCWYQYCLFLLHTMDDAGTACSVAEEGLAAVGGESFALQNVLAVLSRGEKLSKPEHPSPEAILVEQRVACEKVVDSSTSKDAVKAFRAVGKRAAMSGVSDWKVYSQWFGEENIVLKDSRMAEKVLENGMICCSSSQDDAILLRAEAIRYHLLGHHERETLGYAEQEIENISESKDTGRMQAAWNGFVNAERALGLPHSKAEVRRAELFPQSAMSSFLERYRVGTYLPCTDSTYAWVQFTEDFASSKRQEKEALYKEAEPAAERVISAPTLPPSVAPGAEGECVSPDSLAWDPFVPVANPFTPLDAENPDDVVGPRELRGRMVYRVQTDAGTSSRLKLEERKRAAVVSRNPVEKADTPMNALIFRTSNIRLTENQSSRLKMLSVDWIMGLLVGSQLNLDEVLKARASRLAAK